jgi:hypothetical protein
MVLRLFATFLTVVFAVCNVSDCQYGTDAFLIHPNQRTIATISQSMLSMMYSNPTYNKRNSNGVNTKTIFSGEVPERAKSLPHRAILSQSFVYTPGSGKKVLLDDLLSPISSIKQTSIVVFLRSLG